LNVFSKKKRKNAWKNDVLKINAIFEFAQISGLFPEKTLKKRLKK